MFSRSQMAFRFACQKLFEISDDQRPYFWTFTFREKLAVKTAIARWSEFVRSLWKMGQHLHTKEQTIIGLRVFELHPGGHGLHIHALLNRRVDIRMIRRRAERYGFFWIQVKRCNEGEGMADYLGKYLSKQNRPEDLKGVRLWQAIGQWGQSKCKDIEIISEFSEAYRARRKYVEAENSAVIKERKQQVVNQRAHEEGYHKVNTCLRKESEFESMMYARAYVAGVRCGKLPPLKKTHWHFWFFEEQVQPEHDWHDWDGIWSNLEESVRSPKKRLRKPKPFTRYFND